MNLVLNKIKNVIQFVKGNRLKHIKYTKNLKNIMKVDIPAELCPLFALYLISVLMRGREAYFLAHNLLELENVFLFQLKMFGDK